MEIQKTNTTYKTARYGCCTFSLILDKRHPKKGKETFPVAMRYTIDRKSWYNYVEGEYTVEDFSKICNMNAKSVRSELYPKKVEFDNLFESYRSIIERLGKNLSLERIRSVITGVGTDDDASFIGIWENMVHKLKTENNGARFTTGESYECALKSFKKIMWRKPIRGFQIGKDELEYWNEGMKNGVKDREGNLVGKLSDTTRGIYLRSCRVVWNECIKNGYLVNQEYPFSNIRKKDLVAIPTGNRRRERYLSVDQMTQLYNVFVSKSYPDTWTKQYTERAHRSLGLFLVQYLCNGFNMADAGELTYSSYYFDTGRKAFKFRRIKTTERSEDGSEVIVPIIPPLQRILDDIAAKPERNARVFPYILKDAAMKEEKRKLISQENSNVQDRVIRICEEVLHWEVRPSSTWCRHSFATNLRNAGIDMQYISESMGHAAGNNSVTELYIEHYPLKKQMEYNSLLLNISNNEKSQKELLMEQLASLSAEELSELLARKK